MLYLGVAQRLQSSKLVKARRQRAFEFSCLRNSANDSVGDTFKLDGAVIDIHNVPIVSILG